MIIANLVVMTQNHGELIGIYTSLNAGGEMRPQLEAEVLAGFGLKEDRYGLRQGTFPSDKPGKPRDVTIISSEGIASANSSLETPYLASETRRNLVTTDVDVDNLIGKYFYVGEVKMIGAWAATPCRRPDDLSGKSGFREAFKEFGGIRAVVLGSGRISLGDTVRLSE